MSKLLIKDIPVEERPRERLIIHGVESLSNEELIAIILKNGTKEESVKVLAIKVLKEFNNIKELQNATINKLTNIKGIGKVKAIELKAAIELGKRVYNDDKLLTQYKLVNAEAIYNFFHHFFINKKQEYFFCLYLDIKKNLIEKKLLFIGTINKSVVHPREIFKEAYNLSASYIICVHNHPSGDINPSIEDMNFTKNIVSIGIIQGIPIIDHIIIGNNQYYSFFENNNI
jgi:DNA repair protein RadC